MYTKFNMNKVKRQVPNFSGFSKIINHNKKKEVSNNSILMNFGMRLKILREMTNLSQEDFCKKYSLDITEYTECEGGKKIMETETARTLIHNLYLQENIFCLLQWIEGEKKPSPLYINLKDVDINHLSPSQMGNFGKKLHIAYGYKSLNDNFVVAIICDSLMGSLYQKSSIVVGDKYDINDPKQLDSINNDFCIIKTKENKDYIRKVIYNNGQFFASTLDPIRQYVFNKDDITYIAKIKALFNNDLFL